MITGSQHQYSFTDYDRMLRSKDLKTTEIRSYNVRQKARAQNSRPQAKTIPQNENQIQFSVELIYRRGYVQSQYEVFTFDQKEQILFLRPSDGELHHKVERYLATAVNLTTGKTRPIQLRARQLLVVDF